jgi:hypothetical protein
MPSAAGSAVAGFTRLGAHAVSDHAPVSLAGMGWLRSSAVRAHGTRRGPDVRGLLIRPTDIGGAALGGLVLDFGEFHWCGTVTKKALAGGQQQQTQAAANPTGRPAPPGQMHPDELIVGMSEFVFAEQVRMALLSERAK